MNIPWEILHPEIKFISMDKDGRWAGYPRRPKRFSVFWGYEGRSYNLDCLNLPTDIYWKDSLQRRPA